MKMITKHQPSIPSHSQTQSKKLNGKKKLFKKINLLLTVLLCCLFSFCITACGNTGASSTENKLDLSILRNADNKFQYDNFEWNSNVEQIKNLMSKSISETETFPLDDQTASVYQTTDKLILDDESATATLEFYDDKLQSVVFDFRLSQNYEQWFETQTKALTALYGEPTDNLNAQNEDLNMKSTIYNWASSDTMLQLMLIEKGESSVSAVIGVLLIP